MSASATDKRRKAANGSATHHAMSARLLELSAETNLPDPYQITEDIVVDPPTRTRRKAMHDAEMQLFLYQQLLATALGAATAAAPPAPPEAIAPEPAALVDDPTDEQRVDYQKALAAWLIRQSYESAAKDWADRREAAESTIESLKDKTDSATEAYDRAFFGDAYDAVVEYFEEKPTLWDLFIPDIKAEFLPKAPVNGKCASCGTVIDEDAAKKAPASST